jgi:broad specificity phosphatase PhoE
MTARLTLICHGSTDAVRAAAFPRDEPLDHHGKIGATGLVGRLPSVDCCWTSPELRTRQTAEALGLSANIQPMLRECDYGRWAGKKFSEIVADQPHGADSWLHDPAAAPHGGEPILDLMRRVATWSPTRRCAANGPSLSPIQRSYGRRSFTRWMRPLSRFGALISDRCRSRG